MEVASMNGSKFLYTLLSMAALSGCASVSVERPTVAAGGEYQPPEGDDVGVTYYEPMFVMVVGCDGNGSQKAEIKTMPDYSKPRVIKWHSGLNGSAHPAFTLGDDWRLDAFDSEAANTNDVLGLAGTIGAAVLGAFGAEGGYTPTDLPPGVYPIAWQATSKQWLVMKDKWLIQFGKCEKKPAEKPPEGPKPPAS
jgi:hypothetical protein